MYQEQVFSNLEQATVKTRKESPKNIIIFAVIAALFALNGFGLLFKGVGIKLRFIDYRICGVLSWIMCILCLVGVVIFVKEAVATGAKDADSRFKEKFMNLVRRIGPEADVFAQLDRMRPIPCGDRELRYDSWLVACTSGEDLDSNYVYPLSQMTNIGTGESNKKPYLYMHFDEDGKKAKHTVYLPKEQAEAIMQEIRSYNPSIKAGL